jgi:hypothetical protein
VTARAGRLAWLVLLAALGGCAGARSFVASPGDYAAYRRTRIAPTLDERLAAASRYLKERPDGTYRRDVARYFERAEPLFYRSKRGSTAGLEAYLQALPAGPHAPEALAHLVELRRQRQPEGEIGRTGLAIERRHARAGAERAAVRAEVSRWIERFLDPEAWRSSIARGPDELVVAWRLGLPAPTCEPLEGGAEARRCQKLLDLPYVLPVAGVQEPREATIAIEVFEDAEGKPRRVRIVGPDLFVRLEEARTARPVAADDSSARIAAVAGAVELVERAHARRVPADPACKQPVVAPVVLDLACGPLRVLAAMGQPIEDEAAGGQAEDRIEITAR